MDWYFCQMKGTTEEEINDADIISCLEFDETGEFIATGDKGGRVVVFKRNQNVIDRDIVDYGVHCTFTSHEPEFDYLKSLEIEEKINKIKWLPQTNDSRFLLSTNDKTIKLWRISERYRRPVGLFNYSNYSEDPSSINSNQMLSCYFQRSQTTSSSSSSSRLNNNSCLPLDGFTNPPSSIPSATTHSLTDHICTDDNLPDKSNGWLASSPGINSNAYMGLRIPQYTQCVEPYVVAQPRRIFANAHAYHINSISVNSDQQTFLSADDLRINIWNLQLTNQSFNVIDIKPNNMEDLVEVITAAQFHPQCCSLLIYSSSKGIIRLCDMRERALCDHSAIVFEEPDDSTNRSFFSEIISSISDINFSHSGRFILSRDYLTLKIWDMNMTKTPLISYPVHDYLRMKLCALYENDCIFDKFECCWSPDDNYVMTGSYNNFFRIMPREPTASPSEVTMEVGRELLTSDRPLQPRVISVEGGHQRQPGEVSVDCLDYQRRLMHLAWRPSGQNLLALAATNNLYILQAKSSSPPQLTPPPPMSANQLSTSPIITQSSSVITQSSISSGYGTAVSSSASNATIAASAAISCSSLACQTPGTQY